VKRLRHAQAALCWALLTCPVAARAGPARVAVADAAADETVARRLRAELVAAGFAVIDVETWDGEASSATVTAAIEASDVAITEVAVAIRIDDDSADVWTIDPATRAVALRDVIRGDGDGTSNPTTIAVRTVETVRAELAAARRALTTSRPPASDERTAPGPVAVPDEPLVEDERRPFVLDLGVGVSASPGGLSVAPTVALGAAWLPIDHVGVGALVIASPFASAVEDDEGSARVWTGLAGAGLVVVSTEPDSIVGVRFDLGLSGCWLHMEGSARDPYVGGSATIGVAAAYLRPLFHVRLTEVVAIQAGATAALVFPRPVVAFAGREAATWGRPLVVGAAGLELSP
jgi:hypothetical protein